MATARETALNPLELLQSLVGSSQDVNKTVSGTETGTQSSATTGTTNQATSGTATGASNQTTTGSADIAGLQQLLAQQQKGITPEMIKAIFQQGAEQVPGIVTAYGNAVGARATDNDPIAQMTLALADKTNNQAAMMQQQLLKDASDTAGRIAEATRSSTTTGTTSSDTAQNTTGTTGQNTTGASSTDKTGTEKTQNDISINNDQLLKILAVALGGSALNAALPAGLEGLLSGMTGGLQGVGAAAGAAAPTWLQKLLGMADPANAPGVGPTNQQLLDIQNLFGNPSANPGLGGIFEGNSNDFAFNDANFWEPGTDLDWNWDGIGP